MERASRRAITVKEMAEMGIAVALGVALSYLSKAIWSMPMGGTLELESSDCGASFVATLPVCGADESPARDAAHSG